MVKENDRLYEAERPVYLLHHPRRFTDVDEAILWLNHVMGSRKFRNRFPEVVSRGVFIKSSNREHAWYDWDSNTISLPPWSLNEYTILHELAHVTSDDETHGVGFRRTLVDLVANHLSKPAAKTLKHSLIAYELEV